MAAAKWATGAAEWWTTSMVAVGWSGRVVDRIRGCVNGGAKVGHWGDGMVDHQHGGSWLVRESWRQNQGM